MKAETVASRAVQQAQDYIAADVPVGEHLADQLLLPLALAGGGAFRTTRPSQHTETNIEVLGRFLDDVTVSTKQVDESAWEVRLTRTATSE